MSVARHDLAGLGVSVAATRGRLGMARQGSAWQGNARQARLGTARRGAA